MIYRTPDPAPPARTSPWPKMCSADFQIRLKGSQVQSLQWRHLDTSLLAGSTMTGIQSHGVEGLTEWAALYQGKRLTLGWDWVLCNDGQLLAGKEVPPRANIQLLDPSGYDLDHEACAAGLLAMVSKIPWQRGVSDWLGQQRAIAPLF